IMAEKPSKAFRDWPADTAEIYRAIADEDRESAAKMAGIRRVSPMTPADREASLTKLHTDLGLKRLTPVWAKLEIFGGLLAVAAGMVAITTWATHAAGDMPTAVVAAGVPLFALGGYLALAGHRSHLYQSNNLLAAHLADEIRKLSPKVRP